MTDGLLKASASQLQLKQLRLFKISAKFTVCFIRYLAQQGETQFPGKINVK